MSATTFGSDRLRVKVRIIAFALMLLMAGSFLFSCGRSSGDDSAEESSSSSATEPAVDLGDIELTQDTDVLEYSAKTVDPLKLVSCANPDVKITATSKIDLARTGEQSVVYKLALGDQTDERTLVFRVRDTKAPTISVTSAKVEINQGDAFDPLANISSVCDPVDGDLPRAEVEPEAKALPGQTESGSNAAVIDADKVYEAGWFVVDSKVDPASPGEYEVAITASDMHGNRATKSYKVAVAEAPHEEAVAADAAPAPAASSYVLNTNTKKFHHPWCNSVSKMSAKNRQDVEATRDEIVSWGYSPCQRCNP